MCTFLLSGKEEEEEDWTRGEDDSFLLGRDQCVCVLLCITVNILLSVSLSMIFLDPSFSILLSTSPSFLLFPPSILIFSSTFHLIVFPAPSSFFGLIFLDCAFDLIIKQFSHMDALLHLLDPHLRHDHHRLSHPPPPPRQRRRRRSAAKRYSQNRGHERARNQGGHGA